MLSKRLLMIAFSVLFSGCICWDAGYTENKSVSKYEISSNDKFPITYSVDISVERGDDFVSLDIKSLREKIESALWATGMFSEVQYGDKGGMSSYHIEFSFRQSGMSEDDSLGLACLAGYTLFLIPVCDICTLDGSAVLSIQGNPIYSTAKAEEVRCLIWLPMAPIGLFMNAWSVWNYAEKGIVNALCESIAQEHKRRFVKDIKTL